MSEKYWISGAQIGVMLALLRNGKCSEVDDILNEVSENQFIGNIRNSKETIKIVRGLTENAKNNMEV